MDGQIINLRQKRKALARGQKAQKAAENRALFGRPTAERKLEEAQNALKSRTHEGHKLSPSDETERDQS